MAKKIAFTLFLFTQLATFAQNFDFGKVSKEELQEQFYPLDSTADAAYLYKYRRTYYDFNEKNGSFNVITEVFNRIKIYKKEGFNKASIGINYYTPGNGRYEKITSLVGHTYNLNGTSINKTKLSKKNIFINKKNKFLSTKKFAMPNIKEGSVIDVKYKITSPFYNKIDDLEFQFDIPVKNLEYVIQVPDFYVFNKINKGHFSIKPRLENKNGLVTILSTYKDGFWSVPIYQNKNLRFTIEVTKYKSKNISALKNNEPFINNINNYKGGVKFELKEINFIKYGGDIESFSTSWKDVSNQIFKSYSFGEELKKVNYFNDDLKVILSKSKTDKDKIASIFKFVKSKVKWNGNYGKYKENGVRKAYKEGVGNSADINLMLTAMLRSANLNSSPVLISTKDNGIPFSPTLEGFNYVISIVDFKDGTYVLLDATEPFSIPNILPERVLNWKGRKVTKDGSSFWVELRSSKLALKENIISVNFEDNLKINGIIRTRFKNLNALNYRNANSDLKNESLISKFEDKYNVEIEDFKLQNKLDLNKPIVRMIKFSSEDLIEGINGKLYIEPLLFLTRHSNPFKLEERKFPIDFTTSWKELNRVTITIPNGYKVEKLPETLAIGLPEDICVFKYQVSQVGDKIKAISVLQFNRPLIGAQYYKDLKDFFDKTVSKQSEKIVLVKE